MSSPITLSFHDGTLLVQGDVPADLIDEVRDFLPDHRVGACRCPAYRYPELVMALRRRQLSYDDQARQYEELDLAPLVERSPRDYQLEAVEAWRKARQQGVIVLPTGSGKSFVAILAMQVRPRSTLVVAPTIDLMNQWHDLLSMTFGKPVGVIGGGSYEVETITVTTYDSAYLNLNHLGHRFGLLIFDECHHLPGKTYSTAAQLSLAPFRLGLTATPERPDSREFMLKDLIGETVYRRDIHEMAGQYLADYETESIKVRLDDEELERYQAARKTFRGFIERNGIRLGGMGGWRNFLRESVRSEEGRQAFQAWREQRKIALATPRKLAILRNLLDKHKGDRIVIFTNDNATVYKVSRDFLVPAITHQTKTKERYETLQKFNDGRYPIVVTSKVLNEGVNVPEANVGIVLSGSGTVREHVQRLGRILRKVGDKRATLYELIAEGTSEEGISDRRRQHDAYR